MRLAELLGGLSIVADLGFGLQPGTAVRTCLLATALAATGLDEADVHDCLHRDAPARGVRGGRARVDGRLRRRHRTQPSGLPHEPGRSCGHRVDALPELTRGMAPDAQPASAFAVRRRRVGPPDRHRVCEVARDTAGRLGLPDSTQRPVPRVRILGGGLGTRRSARRGHPDRLAGGPGGAGGRGVQPTRRSRRRGVVGAPRRRHLGPDDVGCFVGGRRAPARRGRRGRPPRALLEIEPTPTWNAARGLVSVARTFGDLADVKVPHLHGHAERSLASPWAPDDASGWTTSEVEGLEIAALLHDIGRVGVSNAIWEKPGPLTSVEWEQVRMHAYHSERILMSSPSLAAVRDRPPACTTSGSTDPGYHRCSTAPAQPRRPAMLAVADDYAAMRRSRPHRAALDADAGGRSACWTRWPPAASTQDAVDAVLEEAGHRVDRRPRHRPAGLSEREAEVLVLIAAGQHQRRGRRAAVHLPAHGRAPRAAHLRQDRRVDACRRRPVRRPARPGGGQWVGLPMRRRPSRPACCS